MYTIAVIIVLYFYVRLGMWTARKAVGRCERRGAKWGVRLAVVLVCFLIPAGDEIAGRIYFNHLCETEAGAKVYQTIELPAEYWDAEGNPTFYKNWNENLGGKYPLIYSSGTFSDSFNIENAGFKFVDKQTEKALGEVVNFRYWGGWLKRNFSPQNTAISCEINESVINDIFIPKK